jgi:putative ABC transport system permease protein
MLMHSLKLIWNRKGDNALIIIELILAFLVVFFIASFGAYNWHLYNQPLGFEWHDTVEVNISTGGQWDEDDGRTLTQTLQALRDLPEVEWAHGVNMALFRGSRWTSPTAHNGIQVQTMFNQLTDGAPQDLGVELLEGRWFNEADAALDDDVVLINERLRNLLFADESPIGANIRKVDEDDSIEERVPLRVIGVYRDFRQYGEMTELRSYVLKRFPIEDLNFRMSSLQVRMNPGTPIDFEQRLQDTLQAVAPTWRITITPLSKLRDRRIRDVVLPLTIMGLIAGFLLVMVAFGLFGVLWQNVTRRTDELGLRRAVGASRRVIYRQIVSETTLLATLAVAAGLLVAVQFPLTAAIKPLTWASASLGIAMGSTLIIALAAACSLYPAWMAARRPPAEALHWE